MKTLFFLILAQAADGHHATGTSMVALPTTYGSAIACAEAGEAARENNQGLSFLSYTCVPAGQTEASASRSMLQKQAASGGGHAKHD